MIALENGPSHSTRMKRGSIVQLNGTAFNVSFQRQSGIKLKSAAVLYGTFQGLNKMIVEMFLMPKSVKTEMAADVQTSNLVFQSHCTLLEKICSVRPSCTGKKLQSFFYCKTFRNSALSSCTKVLTAVFLDFLVNYSMYYNSSRFLSLNAVSTAKPQYVSSLTTVCTENPSSKLQSVQTLNCVFECATSIFCSCIVVFSTVSPPQIFFLRLY